MSIKFSNNISYDKLDIVYVIRTKEEMNQDPEYGSNFWDFEKSINLKKKENLYSVPARAVKIGESIFDKECQFVAYRIN